MWLTENAETIITIIVEIVNQTKEYKLNNITHSNQARTYRKFSYQCYYNIYIK